MNTDSDEIRIGDHYRRWYIVALAIVLVVIVTFVGLTTDSRSVGLAFAVTLSAAAFVLFLGARIRDHSLTNEGVISASWLSRSFLHFEDVETVVQDIYDRVPRIELIRTGGRKLVLLLEGNDPDEIRDYVMERCPWAVFDDRLEGVVTPPRRPLQDRRAGSAEDRRDERTRAATSRSMRSRRRMAVFHLVLGVIIGLASLVGLAVAISQAYIKGIVVMLSFLLGAISFFIAGLWGLRVRVKQLADREDSP